MLLLSLKTLVVFTMLSRSFIFIIFRSYQLFHVAFIVVIVQFFQIVVIPNFHIDIFYIISKSFVRCRHLRFNWLEGKSTLRSADQTAVVFPEVEVCGWTPLFSSCSLCWKNTYHYNSSTIYLIMSSYMFLVMTKGKHVVTLVKDSIINLSIN